MVSWSNNPDWARPLEREFCGHVSDRFIPCAQRRPCPIHDKALLPLHRSGESVNPPAPRTSLRSFEEDW